MTTRRLQQLHPPESTPVEAGDGTHIEIAATSPGRWEGHVQLDDGRTTPFIAHRDGQQVHVWIAGESYVFSPPTPATRTRRSGQPAGGDIVSPVPGVVVTVLVASDDIVEAGQDLVIIESMKTEHLVKSPRDGVVESVLVQEGEQVERGVVLVALVEVGIPTKQT